MQAFQQQFLQYCIERGVLKFGEFTLKSGRVSPYFFNAGLFNRGADLAALGDFYAQAIHHAGAKFDLLFGPAYKGIPLAAVTCAALADHQIDPGPDFTFSGPWGGLAVCIRPDDPRGNFPPVTWTYDPTNGTRSAGDIIMYQ